MKALQAWIRQHIIDVDPNPQYSRLDRLDGHTQTQEGA